MIHTEIDYNILAETFRSGSKPPSAFEVGVEWEKVGIHRDTGLAIPYNGPRGVRVILETLKTRFGWTPVLSGSGEPIALTKGPVSITLEPGGQIELSGQKAKKLTENAAELYRHLTEIREVSEPLGIAWLGIGAQPFSRQNEIEWTPKERYAIMRETLKDSGNRTYSMMKETASVQVSLDYSDEHDAVEKLRLAMALSPVLTALFANSPLEGGKRSPYLSRRAHIWLQTAPERSGVLWDVFNPSFSFNDYVRYALEVPALFIQRNKSWIQLPRMRFADFLKSGWGGYEPEPGDWELHLTSLFTEARLKKYVEIRSVDCQSVPTGLAVVAFLKGLFYDTASRRGAWELLKDLSIDERKTLQEKTPVLALKTPFKGKTMLYAGRALAEMAKSGLAGDEKKFLEPLEALLAAQKCPAEILLDCECGTAPAGATIERLIECAGI